MMTAIYPGTFDPFTYGHLDILRRGMRLCDQVIIAVADNSNKKPLFSIEQRCDFIAKDIAYHKLQNVAVAFFDGLLVRFAAQRKARTIIRGLRALSDFEYEFQMASMNAHLDPAIETIFLAASIKHHFISSRMVKEVAQRGGDVSDFVSLPVRTALTRHYAPQGSKKNS